MIYEKKNKIYLIGFMGSGKSTLGKKLARLLHYDFSDLDQYIESTAAASISNIFDLQGEDYFRKLESKCLNDFNNEAYKVIATGGGTPCFHDNMNLMLSQGCCVYIRMPEGALLERLRKAAPKRPLLAGKDENALRTYIHDTLKAREETYLKSHIVIDGVSLSMPSLAQILKSKMMERAH